METTEKIPPEYTKNSLKDFSQRTTLHGLYDVVFETSFTIRALWAVALMLACGMMVMETLSISKRYLSEPTVSHITTTTPRMFPEIYFCPSTFVDSEKSKALGFDRDVYQYYKSLNTWGSLLETNYFENMFDNMEPEDFFKTRFLQIQRMGGKFYYFLKQHGVTNYTQLTELISYDIEDVVTIKKQMHNPVIAVTKVHVVNTMCYGIKDLSTFAEMEVTHTSLEFFIHDFQRIFPPFNQFDTVYLGQGMGVGPFGGFSVVSSVDQTISLTTVHYKKENLKRKPCSRTWSYVERDKCVMDCVNRDVCIFMANCTFPLPWDDSISDLCTLYSPVSCIGESTTRLGERQKIFEKCNKDCPNPCEMWLYQATVTPTKRADNVSWSHFRVKYTDPSNSMQVTEVLTESWSTLLSGFGGNFSLWTGASLVSFVQLFSCCCSRIMSTKSLFKNSKSEVNAIV